ncbi:MAG: hypothetical protein LBN00_08815 [Oscillospiraceae bacterium]|jgi:hypothetical protein|nr:hypothetical protein [Oscillospiraceae bacterium]
MGGLVYLLGSPLFWGLFIAAAAISSLLTRGFIKRKNPVRPVMPPRPVPPPAPPAPPQPDNRPCGENSPGPIKRPCYRDAKK